MSRWPEYRRALNATHFEHATYALLMQAPFVAFGYAWMGALFAIGFFLGREHAQAQAAYGLGDIHAFDYRRWSLDARLDFICPALAVLLVAGFSYCVQYRTF